MIDDDELQRRRSLTFAQAEGIDPIPTQLATKTISREMRARLWDVVYESLKATRVREVGRQNVYFVGGEWYQILRDWHLDVLHRFSDDFSKSWAVWLPALKTLFENEKYHAVLGFVQYVMRHRNPPTNFAHAVQKALEASRSAYRVVAGDTIAPIASEGEGQAVSIAFEQLRGTAFKGPRVHLKAAAAALSSGEWASSVRESINAVEAVVRLLAKSTSVSDALKRLANKGHINRNMSAGLERLYAYTSDERGIRHPLLDDGDANVDEADAVYMFGASAAFITYLMTKARTVGLLEG